MVGDDLEREKRWELKKLKIEKVNKNKKEFIKYSVRTKLREA